MVDKREFLAVPYEEREAARRAGARWDATLKSWYIGDGADRSRLQKWLPGDEGPIVAPRDEFIESMTAHGLLADGQHPIGDGKSHRVPVEGDKQVANGRFPRPSGRYALHLDGHPAGYVRNFRKGTYASWKSSGFKLPAHEMAALRAEIAEREIENAAELQKTLEEAAIKAQRRTAGLVQTERPTAYMAAKGIAPTKGALTDARGIVTYLPAIDITGKQWTLQTIRRDGTKLFQKDSRKEGTFHVVDGDLPSLDRATILIVAEGYATAVIVGEVVRAPTIAAFDAGNLGAVAAALRDRFPEKPILIAGDDDHGVEMREGHNPGREKASAAAQTVEGAAVFPRFAPGEQDTDPRAFTDFHDLATRSQLGRDGVRAQITAAVSELTCPPGGKQMETAMPNENAERPEREETKSPPENLALPMDMPLSGQADDRASLAANAIFVAAVDPDARERSEGGEAGERRPTYERGDVPVDLAGRYRVERSRWRSQDDYYEGSSTDRAAFHDQGRRLVSEMESAAVIADMIAIAEHRGWAAIQVQGTNEFKREAWLRAQRVGLEVSGYQPSEVDRQEARRRAPSAQPHQDRQWAPAGDQGVERSGDDRSARLYLAVPFSEKDEAKAAGARWDREAKSWYVASDDRTPVERWIPDPAQEKAQRTIAGDRAARAQMRTIEAVVSKTLGEDQTAAKRLLDTGREALAAKVERGEPITPPSLKRDTSSPDLTPPVPSDQPAANRQPRQRSRAR